MSFIKRMLDEGKREQEPAKNNQTIDLELFKARMVARANAEVPPHIRGMNPEQCRAEIRRLLSIKDKYPGRDWAQKIMERIRLGERVPLISETWAREVLLSSVQREPGEDDEG
jgi:hypothetical protein